jgi:hypothetical protein
MYMYIIIYIHFVYIDVWGEKSSQYFFPHRDFYVLYGPVLLKSLVYMWGENTITQN